MKTNALVAMAGVGVLSVASATFSAQILLTPASVIGGSGSYGGTFNSGQFNATQVLDTQTGLVTEPTQNGFWLNPDNGPADGYIVIDLGAAYTLSQIDLFNTHNAQYNDRGTGTFDVVGANSVTDTGSGNFDISGPSSTLVSSTLAAQTGDPIADQPFSVSDTGSYRYIRFDATGVAVGGTSCCGANNYGLSEIRFSTPEPAALALLGTAGGGLLVRRRR